jgi:hypothetical protein
VQLAHRVVGHLDRHLVLDPPRDEPFNLSALAKLGARLARRGRLRVTIQALGELGRVA